MKQFRKIKLILIVLGIIFLFVNFGIANENITIKLGHHHNVGSNEDLTANEFKKLVEGESGGKIEIQIFPGAQLGQETEAAQGVLLGTLQMTIVTPDKFKDNIFGMGIDGLPFLFKNMDEQKKIMDLNSLVGSKLNERMIAKGARILGWYGYGSRQLIFVNKNVKTFDELKGLKMRSPESDVFIEMFRRMGTIPTPVTWGEAYIALQTGLVEGMDSALLDVRDMNFYEVTKYVLMTNHMLGLSSLLINEKFFQNLPLDYQEILINAGEKAAEFYENLVYEDEKEIAGWLVEKGMILNTPSKEDIEKFRLALVPMQDQWAEKHRCTDILTDIRNLQQ